MSTSRVLVIVASLVVTTPVIAQQKPPAPRLLGAVEAKSAELFGAVSTARALPEGRVLVNDVLGRRVVLFEKGLSTYRVVADTTAATGNAYSSRMVGLIAFRGDSSLLIDPQSLSMMVVDDKGTIGRVMSLPRPNDAMSMVGGLGGMPGFDGQGRLVYRAQPQPRFVGGPDGPRREGAGGPGARRMPEFPDSAALVRVELATRKLDTVAFLKIPRTRMTTTSDSSGRVMVSPIIHPLPQVDDWAVLSDGSVAVVRGLDYHVDWTRPNGDTSSSERIPFEWRHLNDSAKAAFLDSTRVAMQQMRDQAMKQAAANPGQAGVNPGRAATIMGVEAAVAGAPVVIFRGEGLRGGDAPRGRNEAGGPPPNFVIPPLTFVEPNELPDYAPPFTTGAARADLDGNLWIRTTIAVNGGPVYDVVNGQGTLIDRVVLPAGRVIAGFGRDGLVYMGVREEGGVRVEQARRTSVLP
jgi:hypothetical protein